MRLLNNRFVRIFLVVVLVLSFSLSFAFADVNSLYVPWSEPAVGDNQGWITVWCADNSYYTYYWSQTNYTNGYPCSVSLDITTNYINFTFASNGGFRYSMSYLSSAGNNSIYWSGVVTSADGAIVKSIDFSGKTIFAVSYSGNIGTVSSTVRTGANVNFGTGYLFNQFTGILNSTMLDILAELQGQGLSIDSINSYARTISSNLSKAYTELLDIGKSLDRIDVDATTIINILREWAATTLDESTNPLPNQGLNDFESSQGSLRNDSDVSSSLDTVFNDVDFGSFNNGFSAVWSLVDGVLGSHPIFFTLVILVLSLGLLNLIFNRR